MKIDYKTIFKSEYFRYLVAGVLTTVISLIIFYCLIMVDADYRIATVISFIVSASIAYFINKMYVFNFKTNSLREVFVGYIKFMGSRLFTLSVDLVGMIILVQYIFLSEMVSKVIANLIVIILNYVISKVMIFREIK